MSPDAMAEVNGSSLPVETIVPTAVKIRQNSDSRKNRSAGRLGTPGDAAEVAIVRDYRSIGWRPSVCSAGQRITPACSCPAHEFTWATAARAILRVRFEMARELTPGRATRFAPGILGSLATRIRDASTSIFR